MEAQKIIILIDERGVHVNASDHQINKWENDILIHNYTPIKTSYSKWFKWLLLKLVGMRLTKVEKPGKYHDLTKIGMHIIIAVFLLFLFSVLASGCITLPPGGTKNKTVKYTKVQCPTYPQYKHHVRTRDVKYHNPNNCPAYQKFGRKQPTGVGI